MGLRNAARNTGRQLGSYAVRQVMGTTKKEVADILRSGFRYDCVEQLHAAGALRAPLILNRSAPHR